MLHPLDITPYKQIVILTGAGVSAASGIRTYRGPGGLHEEEGGMEYFGLSRFLANPGEAWKVYSQLRQQAREANPNPAHLAIAEFQKRWQSSRQVTLATQNVDELHLRAGSPYVQELHGSILRTCCTSAHCDLEPFQDTRLYCTPPHIRPHPHTSTSPHPSTPPPTHPHTHTPTQPPIPTSPPRCPRCGSVLRPDIVLFGEPLPLEASWVVRRALRDCDLFLAIGTSGSVSPASDFARSAQYAGARTILINLEPMVPHNPYFEEEILGRAEEILPALLGQGRT